MEKLPPDRSAPGAEIPGPGTYSLAIVGESNYQANLEEICGGRNGDGEDCIVDAELILEETNPYDANAVRIDIDGMTVGYLGREHAKQYRERLRQFGHVVPKATCSANIRGGWDRGDGDRGHYGVWLDIPVDE